MVQMPAHRPAAGCVLSSIHLNRRRGRAAIRLALPDFTMQGLQMEKQSFIHDFQRKLLEMFRASPAADLERNIKALMGQTFSRLDLVTRDEFEIQVELLRALRMRVEALEQKLQESKLDESMSRGPLDQTQP